MAVVPPKTLTLAFKMPVAFGCVVNVTVSCVAVAAVTVPTAPNAVNVTVLFAGVVEKFVPVRRIVGAFCARFDVFAISVGAGTMVATCTVEVVPPKTVTFAFNAPVAVGCVENVTVNCVVVDAVTVPAAPSVVKTTLFWFGVVEKLVPEIVMVGAF